MKDKVIDALYQADDLAISENVDCADVLALINGQEAKIRELESELARYKDRDIRGLRCDDVIEIAKILRNDNCCGDECGECEQPNCIDYIKAKHIVNAGYGSTSRAVAIFAQMLKNRLGLSECNDAAYLHAVDKIIELINEILYSKG